MHIIIRHSRTHGYLLIVNGVTELTHCTFTEATGYAALLIRRELADV